MLLDRLTDEAPGPEAQYESREAISLAFVTAVQMLPPNQRAVLMLRDVLEYRASELDIDAIVALMTDDAWVKMPPLPFEDHGKETAREFFTAIHAHRRRIEKMVPVRANGQPAWGVYARDPVTGLLHGTGVIVLALAGDRICEITRFETAVARTSACPASSTVEPTRARSSACVLRAARSGQRISGVLSDGGPRF